MDDVLALKTSNIRTRASVPLSLYHRAAFSLSSGNGTGNELGSFTTAEGEEVVMLSSDVRAHRYNVHWRLLKI